MYCISIQIYHDLLNTSQPGNITQANKTWTNVLFKKLDCVVCLEKHRSWLPKLGGNETEHNCRELHCCTPAMCLPAKKGPPPGQSRLVVSATRKNVPFCSLHAPTGVGGVIYVIHHDTSKLVLVPFKRICQESLSPSIAPTVHLLVPSNIGIYAELVFNFHKSFKSKLSLLQLALVWNVIESAARLPDNVCTNCFLHSALYLTRRTNKHEAFRKPESTSHGYPEHHGSHTCIAGNKAAKAATRPNG